MSNIVNYVPLVAVTLLIAGILGLYFSPGARKARAERAAERQRAEEARQRADEALRTHAQGLFELFVSDDARPLPNLTTDVQGVILKGDETCCALSANAQHIVTRNKTRYVGASQGVSIRIAKGVRYHVSGYSGHPVTEQYETVSDSGSVYVTNKRFIFAGSKEVTTVPAAKIADVHLEGARVVVVVENRVNPLVVGITQAYWAPVIAAATHRAAQNASAATAAKTK
jgi:hypothetical protein